MRGVSESFGSKLLENRFNSLLGGLLRQEASPFIESSFKLMLSPL